MSSEMYLEIMQEIMNVKSSVAASLVVNSKLQDIPEEFQRQIKKRKSSNEQPVLREPSPESPSEAALARQQSKNYETESVSIRSTSISNTNPIPSTSQHDVSYRRKLKLLRTLVLILILIVIFCLKQLIIKGLNVTKCLEEYHNQVLSKKDKYLSSCERL